MQSVAEKNIFLLVSRNHRLALADYFCRTSRFIRGNICFLLAALFLSQASLAKSSQSIPDGFIAAYFLLNVLHGFYWSEENLSLGTPVNAALPYNKPGSLFGLFDPTRLSEHKASYFIDGIPANNHLQVYVAHVPITQVFDADDGFRIRLNNIVAQARSIEELRLLVHNVMSQSGLNSESLSSEEGFIKEFAESAFHIGEIKGGEIKVSVEKLRAHILSSIRTQSPAISGKKCFKNFKKIVCALENQQRLKRQSEEPTINSQPLSQPDCASESQPYQYQFFYLKEEGNSEPQYDITENPVLLSSQPADPEGWHLSTPYTQVQTRASMQNQALFGATAMGNSAEESPGTSSAHEGAFASGTPIDLERAWDIVKRLVAIYPTADELFWVFASVEHYFGGMSFIHRDGILYPDTVEKHEQFIRSIQSTESGGVEVIAVYCEIVKLLENYFMTPLDDDRLTRFEALLVRNRQEVLNTISVMFQLPKQLRLEVLKPRRTKHRHQGKKKNR